ncbi:uncharacterized protein LOC131949139 isoform X2 [Physella acuta]|uniref:uncharacterized protein LOC131949139 isoform X2 n=1 Tax=Physella acuta TaxID=109671 RepID=UPI0027DB7086|nr:uncharacterized protein LOC131949139 isoform X2 [Physella acuta]XP_059166896.1 uncharacterized protein LOC131949139 isoform X2 [Physella acuta]
MDTFHKRKFQHVSKLRITSKCQLPIMDAESSSAKQDMETITSDGNISTKPYSTSLHSAPETANVAEIIPCIISSARASLSLEPPCNPPNVLITYGDSNEEHDKSPERKHKRNKVKPSLHSSQTKDPDKNTAKVKLDVLPKSKKKLKLNTQWAEELTALTLAVSIGYENPYQKLLMGGSKDQETTKYVTPVEIIQQLLDYKKSGKCSCLDNLCIQDIAAHRIEVTLLDRHSRDVFIMGMLRCAVFSKKEKKAGGSRSCNRFNYRILNTKICHACFLHVNNIRGKYMKNLKKHFSTHGVTSRVHGNIGRKPYHAITSVDINDAVDFINSYASTYGTPSPKAPKNVRAKRVIRLPTAVTIRSVHKLYKEHCVQTGKRDVAMASFRRIWNQHTAHVKLSVNDSPSPSKLKPTKNTTPTQTFQMEEHLAAKNSVNAKNDYGNSEMHIAPSKPLLTPSNYTNSDTSMTPGNTVTMFLNNGHSTELIQYNYIYPQNIVQLQSSVQYDNQNQV